MLDFTLTVEMVDNEIEIYQGIINEKQTEIDKLLEETQKLNGRIEIFKRLNGMVEEEVLKRVTTKNMQALSDEVFGKIPTINGLKSTIRQFSQLIEYLEEMKKDLLNQKIK
ncbi:hypothetical protein R6U76_19695 [Lysinibacillus capsici]|uniref:hypothetical protein n=1 Tax=Lysinibacillus capsici TaxID=2115968 RepID=UPI0029DE72FE|nr:hypothetical protein [Lysinibacillus capsici]WPK04824.1 hypothetical protein R6U76_19695 [Lysinibacillus capsici]